MTFTIAQCRAARSLLGWSAAELATAGQVSLMTVKRFELGQTISIASTNKIAATFGAAGIVFIASGETSTSGGPGVRLASKAPSD